MAACMVCSAPDEAPTCRAGRRLDNRSVVPYNPILSTIFNAHINVEICSGPRAVKYLYKYVYKGADMIRVEVAEGQPGMCFGVCARCSWLCDAVGFACDHCCAS